MNNESNTWRTIVIVACCTIAGVFAWQFLTRASSDLQALFVGIFVFGIPAGIPVGLMLRPRPKDARVDAYARGRQDGFNDGYRRGLLQQDGVVEVIVPTHTHELVRV